MELDPEAVARDLVRALRGQRSQTAFARRLGYRSNAVYTWESGRRWPAASTFLSAAQRVGIDLGEGLRGFYRRAPVPEGDPATPEGVAALLRDLRGDAPIGEIARRADRSRFAVARWLKGTAEPRLPDLLRMIEATSLRLLEWVAIFTDPAALPSTAAAWVRLEAARSLALASPWTNAVLLALELVPYQALPHHDDAFVAARLGLPVEDVTAALARLEAAGQVRFTGTHYVPVEVRALDLRGARPGLKEFWARVAVDRLASGALSYNVFTVSEADLHRIEDMQRAHFRAIRTLVAGSAPAERVALVTLGVVPLG
jgi:transcriptional regulator with XRE-family HTH domain